MGAMGTRSGAKARRLLVSATLAVAVLVTAVAVTSVVPPPRAALALRNPIPLDQVFRSLDRDSRWPEQWIEAICEPPVYRLRNHDGLPHATSAATCSSRIQLGGDVDYLMIANYPDEWLMRQDLHHDGYTFYSSARRYGRVFVAATVSETTVIGSAGLPVASSLRPLEQFGLKIHRVPQDP